MTILGLTLALQEKGVQVFTCQDAKAPLHRVLRELVASIEEVRLGILGRPETGERGESFVEMAPMRIKGLPPKFRDQLGLVVARHEHEAAGFLYDRFEPSGSSEMDTLIREARGRKGSKSTRVEWLLERLVHLDSDDEEDLPFIVHPLRRRRRGRPIRCIWRTDDFARHFHMISDSMPRVYLPRVEPRFRHENPGRYIVIERTRALGRHRVPQWDLLLADTSDESSPIIRGWFEGRWFDIPLNQADLRLVEVFDDGGRLIRASGGDFLYGQFLSPRFVVRVPGRPSRRKTRSSEALPEVARGLPAAYLLDSRCPQDLPDDLPVVDRPEEAWAVLMRTRSGVFVPDAAPNDVPDAIRRMSGAFFVASVPLLRWEGSCP